MTTGLLFSIVTISFNEVRTIETTLCSVLNQTCNCYEYIVIDGGSTDGTSNIIEKYSDKIDYYISEKDQGIFDAMNKGLSYASGRFVLFMNAGDKFSDVCILEKIAKLDLLKYNFLYGDTLHQTKKGIKYYKASPFFLKNNDNLWDTVLAYKIDQKTGMTDLYRSCCRE